jgi:hypothetical protein
LRGWRKFAFAKLKNPAARRNLTVQFKDWLSHQDFKGAHPNEEAQQRARFEKSKVNFTGTLMCGRVAINHILKAMKKKPVTVQDMQQMAEEMAQKECSLLYSSNLNTVYDMASDPRG